MYTHPHAQMYPNQTIGPSSQKNPGLLRGEASCSASSCSPPSRGGLSCGGCGPAHDKIGLAWSQFLAISIGMYGENHDEPWDFGVPFFFPRTSASWCCSYPGCIANATFSTGLWQTWGTSTWFSLGKRSEAGVWCPLCKAKQGSKSPVKELEEKLSKALGRKIKKGDMVWTYQAQLSLLALSCMYRILESALLHVGLCCLLLRLHRARLQWSCHVWAISHHPWWEDASPSMLPTLVSAKGPICKRVQSFWVGKILAPAGS